MSWPAASSTAACTSSRLGAEADPPAARSRPSTSPSRVTATSRGLLLHDPPGGRQVVDDDDVGEQAGDRGAQRRRHRDEVARRAGAGGRRCGCVIGVVVRGGGVDQQPDPAGVVVLEQPDRGLGRAEVADHDRVGGRAERGGDRGLEAGLDGEQGGDRAEHAGEPVAGGEQGAGAVLAGQAQLQRLLAGDCRAARSRSASRSSSRSPVTLSSAAASRSAASSWSESRSSSPASRPATWVSSAGELLPAPTRARSAASSSAGVSRPTSASPASTRLRRAATCPASRARPSRRSAAARAAAATRFCSAASASSACCRAATASASRPRSRSTPASISLLLGPDPLGLAPRAGRGRAGRRPLVVRRVVGRCQVPDPLGGQRLPVPRNRSRSDDRRYQVSCARASVGASAACDCSSSALALGRLGQRGLDLGAALAQRGLVGDLGLERGGQLDQVVGEQAQPRVAQVGLDDGGAAGHLGLPAQRLELAAQLDGEVLHAGEVGLHRVELAQRLLLALAVLEDAGRLLDEAAALLRPGRQDGVELALADDDVHLAADARVGQQLLDVEQPARLAVDRVLRAAVAEHDPRDGDLGVVDRQRAVGVVDGERDLGAAERAGRRHRPAGAAGEDDVLHLAAAQRLGALLAHHPGEGVDDVGLAGAVGADDRGDARLEVERGRRREGLEPLEGEALQVHARNSSAPRTAGRARTGGRGTSGGTSAGKAETEPTGRSPRATPGGDGAPPGLSSSRAWVRGRRGRRPLGFCGVVRCSRCCGVLPLRRARAP